MRHSRRGVLAVAVAVAFCVLTATAQAAPSTYRIPDVRTKADRSKVARTGAAIVQVNRRSVIVTASRSDRRALRRAGFRVVSLRRTNEFPPADSGYHDYAEMVAEINALVASNPALVQRFSLGPRTRVASSGPSRSPTMWPATRPSPRFCSTRASTPVST